MRILNDAIGTKSEDNGEEEKEEEEKERHGDCCEGEEHTPLCQNLSFGTPSRLVQRTLMPLFKDLSQRIADRIGRRCRYKAMAYPGFCHRAAESAQIKKNFGFFILPQEG